MLAGIGIAVIGVTFAYLLPQLAGYGQAWHLVSALSWRWVAILGGCAIFDLATFAPPWQVALPGLRFWPALGVTQASTAASLVVPAGSAVGIAVAYQLLRRCGFASAETGRAVSLTTLWNQLVNLAYPIVAICLLALSGHQTSILVPAAVIGACLLAVVIVGGALVMGSDRLARAIGDRAAGAANAALKVMRRPAVGWNGLTAEQFRVDAVDLVRTRWLPLTVTTAVTASRRCSPRSPCVSALSECPAHACRSLEIFAAWALARFVSGIELTPGGFGVFELSFTAALVGFGGRSSRRPGGGPALPGADRAADARDRIARHLHIARADTQAGSGCWLSLPGIRRLDSMSPLSP